MSVIVSRTCTEHKPEGQYPVSRPLGDFRERDAYVLLGEPGMGKTTSFEQEAAACDGLPLKARDFITLGPGPHWQGRVLFIDALDEMRAGGSDGRTALDKIRERLSDLGRPPFRLSCREADWFSASDRDALSQVSPDGRIVVLHLDKLSLDQVNAILSDTHGIPDVHEFVVKANEHRIADLLYNPQTLKMLAEALKGGQWPQSRQETYVLACRQLVIEHNAEHRRAGRESALSTDRLMDIAGHLCAIQLLAGLSGFALDRDVADADHFPLEGLDLPEGPNLHRALKTGLFQWGSRDEQRQPVHRSIAEFLGARYLSLRMSHHGLPLGRVLALVTGEDGGVVSELRGLLAWLATECLDAREQLIDRDPLGVLLYGDVRHFPPEQKRRILRVLHSEEDGQTAYRDNRWRGSAFGALATADMTETFEGYLTATDRDEDHQSFLYQVLDAVEYGEPFRKLASCLLEMVRDTSYWPGVRRHALRSYLHVAEPKEIAETGSRLLADVRSGVLEDTDDELLGILLERLYPEQLSESQLLEHLHSPKQPNLFGHYKSFWSRTFFDRRPNLHALLDQLVARKDRLPNSREFHALSPFVGEALARGLEDDGDTVSSERLLYWLGLGVDENGHAWLDREQKTRLADWLGRHPDRYKSIELLILDRCREKNDFRHCVFLLEDRLYGAAPPDDLAPWCLEQAEGMEHGESARHLFDLAKQSLLIQHGWERFPFEEIFAWIEERPRFEPWSKDLRVCDYDDYRRELAMDKQKYEAERKERAGERLNRFREYFKEIEQGTAPPEVLHGLARAYRGYVYEAQGDTARERLGKFLGGDEALIQATIKGLKLCPHRDDLPSAKEIVDLAAQRRMHLIRDACLAGMDELREQRPGGILALDDGILERMVAFYLTDGSGSAPSWLSILVRERPDSVARGLIEYVPALLKTGEQYPTGLPELAHEDAYREVARTAVPAMLNGFPLRARTELHPTLTYLLRAGLRHLEKDTLKRLVAKRLSRSMDKAQRVLWLATGLFLDPTRYESRLSDQIVKSQAHSERLAGFVQELWRFVQLQEMLPVSTLSTLVRAIAPSCSPQPWRSGFLSTQEYTSIPVVQSLLDQLAGKPEAEASEHLAQLLDEPKLAQWHDSIRDALESHRVTRREALFQHPPAPEIVRALENREPADPADLSALVLDHLSTVARELRDGDTNAYRAFWDGGKPALENDCRDRLLDRLRPRLSPLGIEAQKEGYFAEDKRADIRVSYRGGDIIVPVEIKRDRHPEIWRALRDQLMRRYTRDPAAGGYGIYLVFWFNGKGMPLPPNGSQKPKAAGELEKKLLDQLSPAERKRAAIVVLDCSRPTP